MQLTAPGDSTFKRKPGVGQGAARGMVEWVDEGERAREDGGDRRPCARARARARGETLSRERDAVGLLGGKVELQEASYNFL